MGYYDDNSKSGVENINGKFYAVFFFRDEFCLFFIINNDLLKADCKEICTEYNRFLNSSILHFPEIIYI